MSVLFEEKINVTINCDVLNEVERQAAETLNVTEAEVELVQALKTTSLDQMLTLNADYEAEVDKVVTKYLLSTAYRCANVKQIDRRDVLFKLVRNRIIHLIIEKNVSLNQVKNLYKGNCQLQPQEERAIIKAYQNDVPGAVNYVMAFMSFKVGMFLSRFKLKSNSELYQSYYKELLIILCRLVKEFDLDRSNGGLSEGYYSFYMNKYLTEDYISKNDIFSYSRKQSDAFVLLKKIPLKDFYTKSFKEITKEYSTSSVKISKEVFLTYVQKMNLFNISETRTEGDDSLCNEEAACVSNETTEFDDIITQEALKSDFSNTLSMDDDERAEILEIIADELTTTGRVKISKRIIKNVANRSGRRVEEIETFIAIYKSNFMA